MTPLRTPINLRLAANGFCCPKSVGRGASPRRTPMRLLALWAGALRIRGQFPTKKALGGLAPAQGGGVAEGNRTLSQVIRNQTVTGENVTASSSIRRRQTEPWGR